jgi:ferredoxin
MKTRRTIIRIDEDKCTGCGQCILACQEGALALVDGKARLVGEVYCDGLGACLGECPEGALTVEEREADDFSERAVEERLKELEGEKPAPEPPLACGCPGHTAMTFARPARGEAKGGVEAESALSHWPIKLKLLRPDAPFLNGADLILLADCAAAAYPNLHQKLIPGRAIAMACPKFDDLDEHIEKLAAILKTARPKSLAVAIMEVPCCGGLVYAAEKAIEKANSPVKLNLLKVRRTGELEDNVRMAV